MPQFEVVVKVQDVSEADTFSARRNVEDRLRAGGIARWQVVDIAVQGTAPMRATIQPPPRSVARPVNRATYTSGSMAVALVVVCALWFLWMIAG